MVNEERLGSMFSFPPITCKFSAYLFIGRPQGEKESEVEPLKSLITDRS